MIRTNEDSGTPRVQRDAQCVECDLMFSTILPEWDTDMCEGCISLLTKEASQIRIDSDVTSQKSPPILIPVTSLSDDNNHILLAPGYNTILPDPQPAIPNDPEIKVVIASPGMRCCCGCGEETSGSHHYCSITGKRVTHLFIHINIQ